MTAYDDNPAPLLLAMYRRLAATGEIAPARRNPALAVDIAGFRRYRGDWIGAVVTPWFLRLLVLPGGGELWREVAPGERLLLEFPAGQLAFVGEATAGAEVPACLYCPLLPSVSELASQDAALEIAMAAFTTLFSPAPPISAADAPAAAESGEHPEPPPLTDRRGFFRRLAGRA